MADARAKRDALAVGKALGAKNFEEYAEADLASVRIEAEEPLKRSPTI